MVKSLAVMTFRFGLSVALVPATMSLLSQLKQHSAALTNASIIRRAQQGERVAQEKLLNDCYELTRRTLFALAGPGSQLDRLQEVALRELVRNVGEYDAEGSFEAWVVGVCYCVANGERVGAAMPPRTALTDLQRARSSAV
jgi:hypothetical protein